VRIRRILPGVAVAAGVLAFILVASTGTAAGAQAPEHVAKMKHPILVTDSSGTAEVTFTVPRYTAYLKGSVGPSNYGGFVVVDVKVHALSGKFNWDPARLSLETVQGSHGTQVTDGANGGLSAVAVPAGETRKGVLAWDIEPGDQILSYYDEGATMVFQVAF
jgi:hypothetical protein